jgi:hypothetical protein
VAQAEQSLVQAIREFSGAPDEPMLAVAEAALGKVRLTQERLPEASALLERALVRMEQQPAGIEVEVAGAEFALARVLLSSEPAAVARGRRLGETARTGFLRLGAQFTGEVSQIDQWLAQLSTPASR